VSTKVLPLSQCLYNKKHVYAAQDCERGQNIHHKNCCARFRAFQGLSIIDALSCQGVLHKNQKRFNSSQRKKDIKNGIVQEFRIPNSAEFLGILKKKGFDLFIPKIADEILHSLTNHFIHAHFLS
jgi:hypothetical protein